MGALWFLLSLLTVQVFAQCNLRLRLSDSKKDGWNGNELTVLVAGKKPAFTVVGSFAKVLPSGAVTLVGGDTGSLQFSAPAGAAITFSYASNPSNWPKENSWSVELFDAYAPFGTVVLSKSKLNTAGIPVAPNIANVVCGPRPVMTGFSVTTVPGPYVHQVKFDWPSLAASDADKAVTYTVSYRKLSDPNPNNWIILVGGTTVSELTTILPPSSNLQFQLIATNQYGPGSAFTWLYNVPAYPATNIYVKMYDSLSNGWGTYDGFVWLALNGITIGSATFPCAKPGTAACASLVLPFAIPKGIAWTLTATFQPPAVSPKDCSFRIMKTTAESSSVFYSGQGTTGPKTPKGTVSLKFAGTPVAVSKAVTAVVTAACPTAEPKVGATCPGVTGACVYDQTCCCPNEPVASQRVCASDTYVCPGKNGKWQQVLTSLPCKTDPTFRCPSQCPVKPPTANSACTIAMSCNYPTVCAKNTTCTQTDTYVCTTNGKKLTWQKSSSCQCKTLPKCAAWQILQTTGATCCTSPPKCVNDPTSKVCLTPSAWSDCIGTCVNGAGTGKKTRKVYKRSGTTCITSTETISCNLTNCPVNCVGAFGAYSTCSATCGSGTQQRVYKITTPAKNGGNACPYANGYVDTRACTGPKACGPSCNLLLYAYDSMKDGWTGNAVVKVTYPGLAKPINITVPSKKAQNQVAFTAPRGVTLTVTYTAGSDPRPTDHSLEIVYVTPPSPNEVPLLQNPAGLKVKTKPAANKTVVVQCVLCTTANIDATCAKLKRRKCSEDKVADNTCGACLPGYTGAKSGNTACTDINECTNSPCGIHVCTNTAGSYTCTCKDGYVMKDGNCVQQNAGCPEFRVRKEWGDMTLDEKDKFVRAVRALGGAYWKKLGDVHSVTFSHPSRIHGSGLFLPWHRGFLKDVEDKLYSLPGDLACTTLPYWDWTRVSVNNDPSTYLKTLFNSDKVNGKWSGLGVKDSTAFDKHKPEHPFSTLTGCYRGNSKSWTAYGPSQIYSLMKAKDYVTLWQALNGGGHNNIHVYVGGHMGTAISSWDPVFFLHHGFVDLLWGGWQACNNLMDANNPGTKGWDPAISFTANMLPSATKTYTPKSVYNSETLKVRWAKAYIQRVVGFNAGYCAKTTSTWFTLLEVEAIPEEGEPQSAGGYPVELTVVTNTSDSSDVENDTETVIVTSPEQSPIIPEDGATPTPTPEAPTETPTETPTSAGTDTGDAPVKTTRKTKLRKKAHGPRKIGVESQMDGDGGVTDNVLVAYETYKTVLEKTGDEDEAISAQIDEECSQSKFTFPSDNMFTEEWIELNPHLRRMCATGDCYHECYLRTSGPTSDQLKSNYAKEKAKGKVEGRKKMRSSRKDITPGSDSIPIPKRKGVSAENVTTTDYSAKSLIESMTFSDFFDTVEF